MQDADVMERHLVTLCSLPSNCGVEIMAAKMDTGASSAGSVVGRFL